MEDFKTYSTNTHYGIVCTCFGGNSVAHVHPSLRYCSVVALTTWNVFVVSVSEKRLHISICNTSMIEAETV